MNGEGKGVFGKSRASIRGMAFAEAVVDPGRTGTSDACRAAKPASGIGRGDSSSTGIRSRRWRSDTCVRELPAWNFTLVAVLFLRALTIHAVPVIAGYTLIRRDRRGLDLDQAAGQGLAADSRLNATSTATGARDCTIQRHCTAGFRRWPSAASPACAASAAFGGVDAASRRAAPHARCLRSVAAIVVSLARFPGHLEIAGGLFAPRQSAMRCQVAAS